MKLVDSWHRNPKVFRDKCLGFTGAMTVQPMLVRVHQVMGLLLGFDVAVDKPLGYEDFRNICFKWHVKLLKVKAQRLMLLFALVCVSSFVLQSFAFLLDGKDFDLIQRAMLVLTKVESSIRSKTVPFVCPHLFCSSCLSFPFSKSLPKPLKIGSRSLLMVVNQEKKSGPTLK
jgi:hypothetical protein